ncbi:hypothetical protein HWV62_21138 [Athelia sp. TMB]|nr:hypothetical protein HWV62_21138 [Athelia sp. TMB]
MTINVLEDPSGGPVETKGGKSDIGDEFDANDQQAAKRSENDANGPVGQENIKGEEDTSQPKKIDPREPKARQDDTLRGGEFSDPTLTSPGNVQMTPDATSPTPTPLKNGATGHLPAYSSSSSQSSVCLDDVLSQEDMIIAVMGPTGAGKSSFISMAIGSDDQTIGHGLQSFTQHVRAVRCRRPDDPRSYVFVDTPGFDDTYLSDADILIRITSWLNATYKQRIHLTAILYLHRISDNRMTGSALRNLELFQRLCGNAALPNVVLVTTMWDDVDRAIGERREKELRDTFWRSMVDSGSRTARFYHTPDSAWKILGPYTGHSRAVKLQIQIEMVDKGIPLSRTAAGFFLKSWLNVLSKQFRIYLTRLQNALRNLPKQLQNDAMFMDIMEKGKATQNNIEKVEVQVSILDDRSSICSDTSSTPTLYETAPSSPLNPKPYSIPSARESLVSLLPRGGMKRDETKMWATVKYRTEETFSSHEGPRVWRFGFD